MSIELSNKEIIQAVKDDIAYLLGKREIPRETFAQRYISGINEVLLDGSAIRNGMIVLIGDPQFRESLTTEEIETLDGTQWMDGRSRLLELNRWCMITQLKRRGNILSFVGYYSDGSVFSRTYNESIHWVVKADLE